MRTSDALPVAVAAGLLGIALAAPTLYHYRCVEEDCGVVSKRCWVNSHPWASAICYFCDNTVFETHPLCEKSYDTYCPYADNNVSCGPRYLGDCDPDYSGAKLGKCINGILQSGDCTIPKCFGT